jgi:disulfide bond formation protein DsbB
MWHGLYASTAQADNGNTSMMAATLKMLLKLWNQLNLRLSWAMLALGCAALLGFGLYLQHVVGLEPCPMCIVQRYAMTLIGLLALLALLVRHTRVQQLLVLLTVLMAGFGAFVAARQSWLQWYPPNIVSCGRDFYGMIESFPLQRAIPLIFRGSGDCTKVDWTFLGGSIANWSFVAFVAMGLWLVLVVWRKIQNRFHAANDAHFEPQP